MSLNSEEQEIKFETSFYFPHPGAFILEKSSELFKLRKFLQMCEIAERQNYTISFSYYFQKRKFENVISLKFCVQP